MCENLDWRCAIFVQPFYWIFVSQYLNARTFNFPFAKQVFCYDHLAELPKEEESLCELFWCLGSLSRFVIKSWTIFLCNFAKLLGWPFSTKSASTLELYSLYCLFIHLDCSLNWQLEWSCSIGQYVLSTLLWHHQHGLFCFESCICTEFQVISAIELCGKHNDTKISIMS